jgi:hypothetical protein
MIYQDTLRTNVIETQTTGAFYAVSTWNAPVGDTAGVGVPGGPSLTNAAWRVGQAEIFSVGQSRNRTFPQVCAWHDVGRCLLVQCSDHHLNLLTDSSLFCAGDIRCGLACLLEWYDNPAGDFTRPCTPRKFLAPRGRAGGKSCWCNHLQPSRHTRHVRHRRRPPPLRA